MAFGLPYPSFLSSVLKNGTIKIVLSLLRQPDAGKRHTHEADTGLVGSQRLQHHRQYLLAFGIRLKSAVSAGHCRDYRGDKEGRIERKTAFPDCPENAVSVVPVAGLEPARCRQRWILSPLRLPIPSHRQVRMYYSHPNEKSQVPCVNFPCFCCD